MLSKDDLLAIGGLLEPINKKLETIEKNMVTKNDLEANNTVIGTIVRVEIASAIKKLETKIDKKVAAQESRIKQLKEEAEFPTTH